MKNFNKGTYKFQKPKTNNSFFYIILYFYRCLEICDKVRKVHVYHNIISTLGWNIISHGQAPLFILCTHMLPIFLVWSSLARVIPNLSRF